MLSVEEKRVAAVAPGKPGFRADIQGLRAIAVGLVVLYHLWPDNLTGGFVGVDVFFVISGFLITQHLLKSPPRTLSDFGSFWARRVRRLLPASLLVLGATLVAARVLAPETAWKETAVQSIASAFYVQNWVLAGSSVDYLAADNAPTAVQHFWSLSVEEQFYLFWPLLIGGVCYAALRRGSRQRSAVLAAVAAVVVVSFAYSVFATWNEPGSAYFVTPTRMWELAIGGLVAALPVRAGLRPGPASILAWAGITGIVVAGVFYTAETPFPGYTAALPVLATALVLWLNEAHRGSPSGILGLRPVQYLGDISYSVYLWHWPLIVLLPTVSGDLGLLDKAVILVATLVLAALSKTFVEDKFRTTRTVKGIAPAFRFAAVGMVAVGLLGATVAIDSNVRSEAAAKAVDEAENSGDPCFGAGSVERGFDACPQDPAAELVPTPVLAREDKPVAYADGCWSEPPYTDRPVCSYGDGDTRVALVGNSHAGHWLPALQVLAEQRDWTIDTYLASTCNPTMARLSFDTAEKADNCLDYGQWVLDRTGGGQYDLILTSERQSVEAEGKTWEETGEVAERGYADYLERWSAGGTPIVVIKDTPFPGQVTGGVPTCLAANPGAADECTGTPESFHWLDPLADAAEGAPGVHLVNMDRYFCVDGVCPTVMGGVVMYFDGSHITATYARSLAPYLGRELDALKLS